MISRANNLEEPLDTSLVFKGDAFNFYTLKRRGMSRVQIRKLEPIKEQVNMNSKRNYSFVIESSNPDKKRTRKVPRKNFNTNSYTSTNVSNIYKQKTGLKHTISKSKSPNRRTTKLQEKLFKEIKDYDEESQAEYKIENKLANYTSEGIQDPIKWGMSNKINFEKLNIFGRNVRHKRTKTKVQEHSVETLTQLVDGDVRLYIPTKGTYKQTYEKAIIQLLLMQSNTGIKFRTGK